ncbi:MAG TPA: S-methyl-5'-thioinosine phosphorylase [Wenzhouxiangellaceae bacterium]|nr:S-methyl-5'-thioinosine phosphorylase [Wenzhouxiangellaceae bacterium]
MKLGVIGGTGALNLFRASRSASLTTPFGPPSDRPRVIVIGDSEIWFLARHGDPHRIPPHKINYRANIHALRTLGVDSVLAVNAVGGLSSELPAGAMLVPDQLIDYTWGRAHTFSDGGSAPLKHIDFTRPFDGPLRDCLLAAGRGAGHELVDGGCHAVTQGPRLETAAEVAQLAAAGCAVVGMTAMPEAALAREAGLDYASLCVVANAGAGLEEGPITEDDIHRVLQTAMQKVKDVIEQLAAAGDH